MTVLQQFPVADIRGQIERCRGAAPWAASRCAGAGGLGALRKLDCSECVHATSIAV